MKTNNLNTLLLCVISFCIGFGGTIMFQEIAKKPNIEQTISKTGYHCLLETKIYKQGKLQYLDEFFGDLSQVDSAKCIKYSEAQEFLKTIKKQNCK